jgi:hypothetical protein
VPKTTHQSVSEFQLRGPIAGLQVLDGILVVRNAIENAVPAAGRTVLPTLRSIAEAQQVVGQTALHSSDFHRIRHLARALEPMSSVTGVEGGDDAALVAARVRAQLAADPVIGAFFSFSGAGANVVMTAKAQPEVANDGTMNIGYVNNGTGMTDAPASGNTTAGVAGVQQVETATAAGTVATPGNAQAVVTAAGMPNSPKTVIFGVLAGEAPAVWAQKCRDALQADPDVSGFFLVSGATTSIILTKRLDGANDATLNVALDNAAVGGSTGITPAPTSANTTAGVAGVAQVETMTVVGSPTKDGTIQVTVTAAGMAGSPRTVGVQVQGGAETDVVVTDTNYADAKASASPAEQVLRASLVAKAAEYIPGFTGARITNGGLF